MTLACYTYEVVIKLNVLAESEEQALEALNQRGGSVYSETKTLLKTQDIEID